MINNKIPLCLFFVYQQFIQKAKNTQEQEAIRRMKIFDNAYRIKKWFMKKQRNDTKQHYNSCYCTRYPCDQM